MSYIEIKNLSYCYGNSDVKVLDNINLDIEKGKIILLLGVCGCGKTSVLKALSGAIPNFYGGQIDGSVIYDGKNLKDISHRDRSKMVSMVFQQSETQLIMDKVHREVGFSLENINADEKSIKRRVFESLKFLNILPLAYKETEKLSGGEKQKVALASALAMNTDVILLDEPTSQLDPQASEEFVNLIKKINIELNKTIIIAEQKTEYFFDIADEIVLLDQGRVIFNGKKEEFYKENYYEYLPAYLKIAKSLNYEKLPSFKEIRKFVLDNINEEAFLSTLNLERPKKTFSLFKRKAEKQYDLSLENINVNFENRNTLNNINLKFNKGKIYSITGENGSGKSTLLKTIMNLVKYEGTIKLNNEDIKNLSTAEIAKKVGYVSQNPYDYISKDTVYDEIKFTLQNFNIDDNERIIEILNEMNLYHLKDRNPRDLSGGEKERLALSCILVMNQEVLLLDEPTKGLDYNQKKEFGNLLKRLKDKGKLIIMINHDIDFVAEYTDDIILLLMGEVIEESSRDSVLKNGLYYTSTVHKIVENKNIYTIEELKKCMN